MSARRKGVRQGAALFLAGAVLVPMLGVINGFTHGPNLLDILVPLAAIIFFLGGLMRMLFAALFEEGAPKPHFVTTSYAPLPVSQLGTQRAGGFTASTKQSRDWPGDPALTPQRFVNPPALPKTRRASWIKTILGIASCLDVRANRPFAFSESVLQGPITFYEWMKAALYDPEQGYYCRSDRERWGRQGDYRTSPERSVLFAATFARYFAKLHQDLGSPRR